MFYLYFPIFAGLIAWLAVMARAAPMGLKSFAPHPFNVLGLVIFVSLLSYANLFNNMLEREPVTFGPIAIVSLSEFYSSANFFLAYSMAMVGGVAIAVMTTRPAAPALPERLDLAATRTVFAVAAVATAIVAANVAIYSLEHGSIFYAATVRTTFFRENAWMLILWYLLCPALFFYGSRRGWTRSTLAAVILSLALVLIFGQRSVILFFGAGLSFWAAQRFRFLAAPASYVALIFVAAGSLFYKYLIRLGDRFSSFAQYLETQGGLFNATFNGPDFASAQANAAILGANPIHREFWESPLAAILAPIPRSLVPFKPLGASTEFTLERDTANWLFYKRELVIGGPADLYIGFGAIGAVLLIGALAYFWARWMLRSRYPGFAAPIAIVLLYVFIRNDTYSVALFLWPTTITYVMIYVSRFMLRGNGSERALEAR